MTQVANASILGLTDILSCMQHTPIDIAEQLLTNLVEQSLNGIVSWQKNLVYTFEKTIQLIDQQISVQLNEIMHHCLFLQLEGSWRGLNYLVFQVETGERLKINVFNSSKKVLFDDLARATEFDQSVLFKKIYEEQFGTPGGEPYSLMVLDYDFNHLATDVKMLYSLANVAASAFCPFIASVAPSFFGFDDWQLLPFPREIARILRSAEYNHWKQLRSFSNSRYLVLTLPRVLARLPYGKCTIPVTTFSYEEADTHLKHNQYCWMNAAYVLAERISFSFGRYGWCTTIRGMTSGGKVEQLPLHTFKGESGDVEFKCPTEVGITDRREAELSALGFLPICHYKNTNYAVFFGAQSVHQPHKYDSAAATNNASIAARLPYLMATSRFTHYLKIMARDKIGAFMRSQEIENWLNQWILDYVNANTQTSQALKAKYPLSAAKVVVESDVEKSGHYKIIAWLKPWLHLEELTASMRLVAKLPKITH
jgi:type VI secretion system protein ImpC